MIVAALLIAFFNIVKVLFSALPDITFNPDSVALMNISEAIRFVCYFLPMDTVAAIFGLILAITSFRIGVSVLKTIWAILPFT